MVDSPKIKILAGFADAIAAPEACWSLLEAGYEVSLLAYANLLPPPITKHTKIPGCFVTSPYEDFNACLSDITAVVEAGFYSAILPLDDASLYLFSKLNCSSAIKVMPPDYSTKVALNKQIQLIEAEKAGFNVPQYSICIGGSELCDPVVCPCVLKPSKAIDIQGNRLMKCESYVCKDQSNFSVMMRYLPDKVDYITQEYIAGTGCGIFGIMDKNELLGITAHERIRMMNPAGSGSSACSSLAVPVDVLPHVKSFLIALEYQGLFMLELLRDDKGTYWFVELNGRTWGSTALARRCGAEYPAWAVDLALGKELTLPPQMPYKPMVCRHLGREILHLMFIIRGPKKGSVQPWPGIYQTVRNLLKKHPNQTWYNLDHRYKKFWLADTLDYLKKQFRR